MKYIPIIGLEIHIETNTVTKMFCGCPQDHFGKRPNTQTCPICLGLPGALPFANKEAIEKTIKLGLALGSKINEESRFYRKHYFYPDLPKSFQTSQKDEVLCIGGELLGKKINHIHLEEDAGKLLHIDGDSLIDFNRSGCALIELVTEPVFHSASEVLAFTKELQLITRYINISNADMEKGTMRLEANVSLSPEVSIEIHPRGVPDYKVELKNINSFRFLEKAIEAEIRRQEIELGKGNKIKQETRGYDEVKQTTYSQRSKEDSQDYRYFPEADLAPINTSDKDIKILSEQLPELPQQKRERFAKEYQLSSDFTEILITDLERCDYFEQAAKLNTNYKTIADLIINKKFDEKYPEPAGLVKKLVELTTVEYASLDDAQKAVDEVINEQAKAVSDYKNGNGNVVGFLIGMTQKKLSGKGNPKLVQEILVKSLQND